MGKNRQNIAKLESRQARFAEMQKPRREGGRMVAGVTEGAFHRPGSNKK